MENAPEYSVRGQKSLLTDGTFIDGWEKLFIKIYDKLLISINEQVSGKAIERNKCILNGDK